jgi:hypothetical protein
VRDVLDDYHDALARLEKVAGVLRRLGPPWQGVTRRLNELTRALHD